MVSSKLKLALCLLLLLTARIAFCGETLAIFLPKELESSVILKSFKESPELSNIEVTIFAKYRDFEENRHLTSFDYAILPSSYRLYNKDFTSVLQFVRGGQSHFQFSILSLGGKWTSEKLDDGVVGIIEELDRKNTKSHLGRIFEGKSFNRIKRVTKSRDLIPLLFLQNADYVVADPDDIPSENKNSLTAVKKSQKVLYPLLYINAKKEKSSANITKFTQMPSSVLKALGFDGIEPLKEGL
ncbi:MAG: hypothetical protein HQK54_03090 [Oligoflexales bacterium]|nr:hypothetical protein [Oligoflexales bacterium]